MRKTETYTSRTDGRVYRRNIDSGDGYWCPAHDDSCSRSCEDRRWGRFGAAGVLFYHRATGTFLLNERSQAIHLGGRWSTLGGAINRNESPLAGALREASEEGAEGAIIQVLAVHEDTTEGANGSWTYTTFVVEVEEAFETDASDWETASNEWLTINEMATKRLHPAFRTSIHTLLKTMVDAGAFR